MRPCLSRDLEGAGQRRRQTSGDKEGMAGGSTPCFSTRLTSHRDSGGRWARVLCGVRRRVERSC